MYRKVMLLVTLIIVLQISLAAGQGRRMPYGFEFQEQTHKIEVTPFGGYVWTVSEGFNTYEYGPGDVDIKSNGFWGIAVDVNVKPGAQLELLYNRLDSELQFKKSKTVLAKTDVAVEYWHIGMVGGVQKGTVMPYTSLTLGATRYVFKTDVVDIDDDWRFSVILGIGAKLYVHERLALRLQGRMPFTFTAGGLSLGCGTGGCGAGVGGTGIVQFDVSVGLAILI